MARVNARQTTNARKAFCCHMKEVYNPSTGETTVRKCNYPLEKGQGIFFRKSATDYGFFCPSCFRTLHGSNNVMAMKQDKAEQKTVAGHGWLCGIEVEENRRDSRFSLILLRSHFVKSLDSSVQNEYISPILGTLNGLGKLLSNLLSQGFYQDEDCGCHVNLSNSKESLAPYVDEIRANYNAIFDRLYYAMDSNPQAMTRLYGRPIVYYCSKRDASHKYSFINVLKLDDGILEFRFPKLVTSKQYLATIHSCRRYHKALYDGLKEKHKQYSATTYDDIARSLVQVFQNDIFMR